MPIQGTACYYWSGAINQKIRESLMNLLWGCMPGGFFCLA